MILNGAQGKGFELGEIFRFVKRMNEKREEDKIVEVTKTFILPDGTRAGVVWLRRTRLPPEKQMEVSWSHEAVFKGEILTEKIRGREVDLIFTIDFTPYGELLYGALLEDGWAVIVKGDTVIDKIQGRRFRGVEGLFLLSNGKLAGNVGFGRGDGRYEVMKVLPFKGKTLIRKIGEREIMYSSKISYVLKDGTLVGDAYLEDGRNVPFKGNTLLDEFQRRKVVETYTPSLSLLPDGTLTGVVKLEDGRELIFKDNALIEEIGGRKIVYADFHVLSDGTFAGRVKLEASDKFVFFKGDTLIDRIQGKEFKGVDLRVSHDILYGAIEVEGGRKIPFKDDTLIDEINGRKVVDVPLVRLSPDKNLVAFVKTEDGRYSMIRGEAITDEIQGRKIRGMSLYEIHFTPDGELLYGALLEDGWAVIVKGDTVIDKIQGRRFRGVEGLFALPDGTIAGQVELEDGRWVPFKGDVLLEELDGRRIIESYLPRPLPDGTVQGNVKIQNEDVRRPFLWYGDEVYSPLL